MQTSFRDHALAKNRLLLKVLLMWALSATAAVLALSFTCVYAFQHKEVHWLPMCTGEEFSISDRTYSPAYLMDMTEKVADLRLTYSPNTVDSRNAKLLYTIPANHQEAFKKQLLSEQKIVHDKNISSVFYAEKINVDVDKAQGRITGLLHRTSHGLQLSPKRKTYQLQFVFKNGLLGLQSMKEINDAN